jgi:4-carboxymuconolactone decarboxylase
MNVPPARSETTPSDEPLLDRSIVVIAILTALSRVDELAFHVPASLNHGLSRVEVEEIMVQMTIYGGVPRAIEGTLAMQEAFAKIDARE